MTIVIKVGGARAVDPAGALADVSELVAQGEDVVVVHGGSTAVDDTARTARHRADVRRDPIRRRRSVYGRRDDGSVRDGLRPPQHATRRRPAEPGRRRRRTQRRGREVAARAPQVRRPRRRRREKEDQARRPLRHDQGGQRRPASNRCSTAHTRRSPARRWPARTGTRFCPSTPTPTVPLRPSPPRWTPRSSC